MSSKLSSAGCVLALLTSLHNQLGVQIGCRDVLLRTVRNGRTERQPSEYTVVLQNLHKGVIRDQQLYAQKLEELKLKAPKKD